MGSEIKTSIGAMRDATTKLTQEVDCYCTFRLTPLSGVLPVSGSGYHDGLLGSQLSSALAAYKDVISSDATAIQSIQSSLAASDNQAAQSLKAR